MASSARPCDVCCQHEELSLPVRRQFEEDDWLRRARVDVRASRPEIGTRQHRADTALAGDPQARRMTGATWWIRQAVARALADKARTIRMPVHVVEKLNKIVRSERKLRAELGREPVAAEIARDLDLT